MARAGERALASIVPRDREHEAPVRHVPAVELDAFGIGKETRDLAFRIAAVVNGGVADPAAAIVRAEDLSPSAPLRRIDVVCGRSCAGLGVREDGADLAIRALADGRLVAEQDQRLSRLSIAQAAAQRLATLCAQRLDPVPADVDAAGSYARKQNVRDGMDVELWGGRNPARSAVAGRRCAGCLRPSYCL